MCVDVFIFRWYLLLKPLEPLSSETGTGCGSLAEQSSQTDTPEPEPASS